MKANLLKPLLVLFIVTFSLLPTMAQENVNASGGKSTGIGGTANYSIGQIFYSTNNGTNGSVVQGVQQPYEISVIIGIEDANKTNLTISAYPNPTFDLLELKVESEKLNNLSYKLFNMNGKLLYSNNILNYQTNIVMRNLVQGTYFVRVSQGNKEVRTFKIFKSNK